MCLPRPAAHVPRWNGYITTGQLPEGPHILLCAVLPGLGCHRIHAHSPFLCVTRLSQRTWSPRPATMYSLESWFPLDSLSIWTP